MLITSKFCPAWWLRNPHAQTLWAAKLMQSPRPTTYRERLTTPDNDFVDLDWSDSASDTNATKKGIGKTPLVVLFHGLTGSSDSPYIRALIDGLCTLGYRAVVMNFRGCSGEPNLKRESYHSGHTKDISFVIDTIYRRYPNAPLAATGYSLGGNALLKYLATKPDNPLRHAISVSPPLLLAEGARRMEAGVSRIYQNRLVGLLKNSLDEKNRLRPELGIARIDYQKSRTFREFDSSATVPLHGFNSVDEYYERASTLGDLPQISTPTHILFSRDDPFFTEACIPKQNAMSEQVTFELTSHGGHVAFIEGSVPGMAKSWLTRRLCEIHQMLFYPSLTTPD